MVTVVITSYNRLDLLETTINSFNKYNTYPVKEIIIIEDSGIKDVHEKLKTKYPNYKLILNEENLGAYESIDIAYSHVTTPFVFHCEDDWEFDKSSFIEPSIKILESNKKIMQVWLANHEKQKIHPEIYYAEDIPYQIVGGDGTWEGFTCHPGLRSMEGYNKTKPWTQWSSPDDYLSLRECKVGWAYRDLGYKAAALLDIPYTHTTGGWRGTWQKRDKERAEQKNKK
jgi:glycosyltransferase involved in cell wall biosynthesis